MLSAVGQETSGLGNGLHIINSSFNDITLKRSAVRQIGQVGRGRSGGKEGSLIVTKKALAMKERLDTLIRSL